MSIRQLRIQNYRGIVEGTINFDGHTLLVGGNNVGKSTICEALDLVLGPERMYRRPVIDEHDFYKNRYLDESGGPIKLVVTAVLTGLSDEQERRFFRHLRRWNNTIGVYVDELGSGAEASDAPNTAWALPLVFIGRYDRDEDDFVGNTFFDHPQNPIEDSSAESIEVRIGEGRTLFGRDQRRYCGFIFLRALRTGSRALSMQRGSLLDTILRLSGNGLTAMWEDTLTRLRELSPPIGEIAQLQIIREQLQSRMERFVSLAADGDARHSSLQISRASISAR